jgi:hypothetical protein
MGMVGGSVRLWEGKFRVPLHAPKVNGTIVSNNINISLVTIVPLSTRL